MAVIMESVRNTRNMTMEAEYKLRIQHLHNVLGFKSKDWDMRIPFINFDLITLCLHASKYWENGAWGVQRKI